ncbi:MAG: ASKHA domain-containing protein [Bacillota bacterium]
MTCKVTFTPDNLTVEADEHESLVALAARAGIILRGACGGAGTCGRCRVSLALGSVAVREEGEVHSPAEVPACRAYPVTDVVVEIPESARLGSHRVLVEERGRGQLDEAPASTEAPLAPLYESIELAMAAPTLDDARDDWGRLRAELQKKVPGINPSLTLDFARKLPGAVRKGNWRVTVDLAHAGAFTELAGISVAETSSPRFGLAVDLGTTTVACHMVSLLDGTTVASAGTYNRQAAFGDDVISRIIYATEEPGGLDRLQEEAVVTINSLVEELVEDLGAGYDDIRAVYVAGNPTMTHLFLGVNPAYLRLEPYVPAVNSWPPVRAGELGLRVHPRAWTHCAPGVASYLGGDITAGLVVAGLPDTDQLTLFVDIGTNGEMVLGNRDWLVGCACSAGPSFEGSGITGGMRAVEGAIEMVGVSSGGYEVFWRTIGGLPPRGICGTGLIDALAALRGAGVIDRGGRFVSGLDTPRLRMGPEGREFVLVWGSESGHGRDIVLSEADLDNLMRAKAAVFAGIKAMVDAVGLQISDIERVLIAGGFGRHLNLARAVAVGILPDLPAERYRFLGNTSLKGARLALLSREVRDKVEEVARSLTYLDLSAGTSFMDEFMSALFIPHTDMGLFPSVADQGGD